MNNKIVVVGLAVLLSLTALAGVSKYAEITLDQAVALRVKIILAMISDKQEPLEHETLKRAIFFCLNVKEIGFPDDLLSEVWDITVPNRALAQPFSKMSKKGIELRQDILLALCNKHFAESMAKTIAKATVVEDDPEETRKNRKLLLEAIEIATAYMFAIDLEKEKQWHEECQQAIENQVVIDPDGGYFDLLYRFNNYGPGEYKEGALPNRYRYIQAFIYRRLESDKMSKRQIFYILMVLSEALRHPFEEVNP